MTGRISVGAAALLVLLLSRDASAQYLYVVTPAPKPPPPPMWWGSASQGLPVVCGYASCCEGRKQCFFAQASGTPYYNAVSYGPLAEYPTYGPPPKGYKPGKGPFAPPSIRMMNPVLFGKKSTGHGE